MFDLSEIYNPGNNGDEEIRSYEEGELLDIDDKNETDSSLNDECGYRRYEHCKWIDFLLFSSILLGYCCNSR